jgi:hypothetical protein
MIIIVYGSIYRPPPTVVRHSSEKGAIIFFRFIFRPNYYFNIYNDVFEQKKGI